jgi:hypothetical protein
VACEALKRTPSETASKVLDVKTLARNISAYKKNENQIPLINNDDVKEMSSPSNFIPAINENAEDVAKDSKLTEGVVEVQEVESEDGA